MRCRKTKGIDDDVSVEWISRRPFPPKEGDNGPLVLLNTVIATGDIGDKIYGAMI